MSTEEIKKRGRPAKSTITDETNVEPSAMEGFERKYKNQIEFDHDLYKLEVSHFLKNTAIDGQRPEYVKAEHVHFFHTVNSSGKTQIYSTPVGGHFHKMKVIHEKGKAPRVVCDSGPLKFVTTKNEYGERKKITEALNKADTHTHDVIYLKSDKLKPRNSNAEAVKLQSRIADHQAKTTATIEGITG
jgi:hypothetical protein